MSTFLHFIGIGRNLDNKLLRRIVRRGTFIGRRAARASNNRLALVGDGNSNLEAHPLRYVDAAGCALLPPFDVQLMDVHQLKAECRANSTNSHEARRVFQRELRDRREKRRAMVHVHRK